MSEKLTTKYIPYVDEVFTKESKKELLTNKDFDFNGAHTVKVYKVGTSPMNDYGRNANNTNGMMRYGVPEDLSATVETFELKKDRSFTFCIDTLDMNETQKVLAGASALARQVRQVVVPEVDTYTYGVMCASAGHKPDAKVLTSENIYDEIITASAALDNASVPETGRVLTVTPDVYLLVKKCSDITLSTELDVELKIKGVIANLDGALTIKIGADRMQAGFGFMLSHPCATVGVTKLDDYNTHENPPGLSGTLVEGRIVYDAFVLENKACAIYYQRQPLDNLTVTSKEGSTSGKTAITVSPEKVTGNSYVYATGATVTVPGLGDDCSDMTAWDGTAAITATTGNEIVIVEVDGDSKAVKAGVATVTSKA